MLRIDEILKERGITNPEFSKMIGVSETSASGLKSGRTKPRFDTLMKISEALDIDVRELFSPSKGGSLLNGFVDYNGTVYRINTEKDLETLLDEIKKRR